MTQPVTITLQLDLDRHLIGDTYTDPETGEPTAGPTTLEDVVLHMAAQQLVDRVINQQTGKGGWFDSLSKKVGTIRDDVIRARLEPLIEEAVTASVQPTNGLGEATCAPTTLRSIIVERGTQYLQGRESNPGRNPGRKTRLQAIIDDSVDRAFKRDLQAAIDAGKAEALGAIRAAAADVVAGTIAAAAAKPPTT